MIFKPKDYAPEELFQLNERKYSIFYRKNSDDYTDFVIQQGSTPSGNGHLSTMNDFLQKKDIHCKNHHLKFSLAPKLIIQRFLSMVITY